MEIDQSFLGFEETTSRHVNPSSGGGGGYKLVPWLSWNEWDSVRNSLFSSSPLSVSSALRRITAWRSRGCLPVVIEVTASIAEIQLKDPFFRGDRGDDASDSDEMLTMMYCMAIVRLVNGVVEKTRKKTEVSIGEAADVLNIPRMLIDIRHEGSHRDLPSLRLVRLASIKALDWLKSYYWEPQKKAIPFQSAGTSDVIKEIKSRLYELAFCLNIKQARRSSSSRAKEKRIKHRERLCGRNKFLSLMAAKHQYSKSTGSMRQITKALKHLLRLYSSYSSEVVSVLIELLLKASDSSDFTKLPHDYQVSHGTYHVQSDFDDWKPVIAKLSNKEPELLLSLTKGALKMIETQEAMKHESAEGAISENAAAVSENERLSDLVEWLITNLKGLKSIPSKDSSVTEACSTDRSLPKATLLQLLRKSLLVSSHRNTQLNNSALILARMIGNSSLVEKLNKLCRLWASNPIISEENSSSVASDSVHVPQEADSIREAVEKFAFIKNLRRTKSNVLKTREGALGNSNRWVVAKSWNSCQIGMLPHDIGSSGRLPVLDCGDNHKEVPKPIQSEEVQREEQRILNEGTRKRGSDCDVEILEKSNFKKMRENEEAYEINGEADDTMSEGVEGRLMIGGVWKKVREEELRAIASAVRILV